MGEEGDGVNGEGHEAQANGNVSGNRNKKNNMDDAKERIEAFDWEELEGRFWDKMEECRKVEEGIMEEFKELMEVSTRRPCIP